MRAALAPIHPIGPRNQPGTRAISNVETKYSEQIQQAAVARIAPVRFIIPTKASASADPIKPPAGITPPIGCQPETKPSPAQVEPIKITAPQSFAHAESTLVDQISFNPSQKIRPGIAYAPSPSDCSRKSESSAPVRPVRFAGFATSEAVFKEGSKGW